MNKLEHRSYAFDIDAETEENVLVGRPIVYENKTDIGDFDEIIKAGALDKTDLKDVRFLVNHDTSKIPLARSRRNNANSTMQLIPDEKGMSIKVKLDTENNTDARSLYSAVKRGDVSGMSFAFSVDKEEWSNLNTEHPTRNIRSISKVVEVSAVTFPAYDATSINARDGEEALKNARKELDEARAKQLELDKEKAKWYIDEIKRELDERYNPYHDAKTGRFTGAGGAGNGMVWVPHAGTGEKHF